MALPFRQIMFGASAFNAVSNLLNPADLNNIKELTFYIMFSTGVDGGAVKLEESPLELFTGTWAPIGTAVTFGNNVVKTVKASGVDMFARVRVSTLITNGTVSVYVIGR